MTQYTPRAFTDDEVGEGFWTLWNGLIPAYLSGQAGTNVPAGVGKGFVYTKLDGDGNILGAFFADGLGGESPVSPAHILWGVTDAAEARSALGIDAATAEAFGLGPRVHYLTGTGSILRQTGVSSVVRLAAGKHRVTLAEAQPDATYTVVAQNMGEPAGSAVLFANIRNRTTTSFEVWTGFVTSASDSFQDYDFFVEVRR